MSDPIKYPLPRKVRAAYRTTAKYRVEQLLAEETRWKRKATIAANKLADVRGRMVKEMQALAEANTNGKVSDETANC